MPASRYTPDLLSEQDEVAKQATTRHGHRMALPKRVSKGTARRAKTQPVRRGPAPPLGASTTCDSAFRIIAGRHLKELTRHHRATCGGDADALHDMRIALTRLRAAIAFFSPMVRGLQQLRLADEFKWL